MIAKKKYIYGIIMLTLCIGGCQSADEVKAKQPVSAEIMDVKYGRDAIITIISDDGVYESGVILNNLAEKNDLQVTVSMPIEEAKKNLKEWKKIEKDGRIEIISHSYTHTVIPKDDSMSEEDMKHEIVESKKFLQKHFETEQIAYIPSNNSLSTKAYKMLENNGFYAVRQGERGLNSTSPKEGTGGAQWMNLLTRGIGDVVTTEERNEFVEQAIQEEAWLIEMWHCISPNGDVSYQPISTEMADEHLEYISNMQKKEKIWVAGFTEATKYIREKQNCRVSAYQADEKIIVKLDYANGKLPKKEFDAPLTVKVNIPNDWNEIKVEQDHKTEYVLAQQEGSKRQVLFEMIPGKKNAVITEHN